ncbi:hypothetical protein N9219_01570, partial [bacterium]|nr:hypothetical protein [bacterium]
MFPASGLINAAVIFDAVAFKGSIPIAGVKNRGASPIGDDKFKTGVHRRIDTLPTQKFTIGAQQDILDATW